MKVLIFGVSGMLGNTLLRDFSTDSRFETFGTLRGESVDHLDQNISKQVITGVTVDAVDSIVRVLNLVRPDVVINCVGVVKQLPSAHDALTVIPINSVLPHRLAHMCNMVGARMIHVSTDCVFSGAKGMYREEDRPDAEDLYGRSKHLGEVNYPNTVTLRTSIIGHEIRTAKSLVSWFLEQKSAVQGFTKAVFSGLPTIELSRIIRNFIMFNPSLTGLYHVSAEPISKYELLSLVGQIYGHNVEIVPVDGPIIDRSLNSSMFRNATGFKPATWPELVLSMSRFR